MPGAASAARGLREWGMEDLHPEVLLVAAVARTSDRPQADAGRLVVVHPRAVEDADQAGRAIPVAGPSPAGVEMRGERFAMGLPYPANCISARRR